MHLVFGRYFGGKRCTGHVHPERSLRLIQLRLTRVRCIWLCIMVGCDQYLLKLFSLFFFGTKLSVLHRRREGTVPKWLSCSDTLIVTSLHLVVHYKRANSLVPPRQHTISCLLFVWRSNYPWSSASPQTQNSAVRCLRASLSHGHQHLFPRSWGRAENHQYRAWGEIIYYVLLAWPNSCKPRTPRKH